MILIREMTAADNRRDSPPPRRGAEGANQFRAILRAGSYELMFMDRVPARVALNEYVELAHAFFDGEEAGFINGVLNQLARTSRPAEFGTPA